MKKREYELRVSVVLAVFEFAEFAVDVRTELRFSIFCVPVKAFMNVNALYIHAMFSCSLRCSAGHKHAFLLLYF